MYLAPDGDEAEIADAAARFLADSIPISRLHLPDCADLSPKQRSLVGENGWFALTVPEARGGSGLSPVEHALFCREAGRQCGPLDLLAQCLAANMLRDDELRQQVIQGRSGVALLVRDGESWRVLGHAEAELAVLVSETEASVIRLDQPALEPRPALDPANTIRVTRVLPPALERTAGSAVWRLGQLGAAAMLVGIAEAALDLIVEYAKVRETFGRKIGAWQAVRHPCADMAVRAEAARAQLWYAAAAIKEARGDAAAHLAAAKHLANTAALANADSAIQLHGGIGVTDEHDANLLLKHAMLLSRLFGTKRGLLGQLLHAQLED